MPEHETLFQKMQELPRNRSQEIVDDESMNYFEDQPVVAEKMFGPYRLYVTKTDPSILPSFISSKLPNPWYQLALEKNGFSARSLQDQFRKTPIQTKDIVNPFAIREEIRETIREWMNQFGDLFFSSMAPWKTQKYVSILSHMGIQFESIPLGPATVYRITGIQQTASSWLSRCVLA